MVLIDALAAGNVIMLVTTPDVDNKNLCRLDFITSEEGKINDVRRALVDQLSSEKIQFNVSSLEVRNGKELRTVIFDPSSTKPVDYDRIAATKLSRMLLNTKGVLNFTSAFTHIENANQDKNIAMFAKVMKNKYIVEDTAVLLAYDSAAGNNEGSFNFKMTSLEKMGTFMVLGDSIDHYGSLKLNATEEFYIEEKVKEGDVSLVMRKVLNSIDDMAKRDPIEAQVSNRPNNAKKTDKEGLSKYLDVNNKVITAGAGVLALTTLGAIASNSLNKKNGNDGAPIFFGKSLDEDKVEIGGELLTRSEAEELYKSL